jgi:hypothetical protein
MIGTATMPLITAVQNNMAMGSMFVAASAPPPERCGSNNRVEAERTIRWQLKTPAHSEGFGYRIRR